LFNSGADIISDRLIKQSEAGSQ